MLATPNWQLGPPFKGDDPEDSQLLSAMAEKAKAYLRSFRWTPDIEHMYFNGGVGKIIAPFLVRFSEALPSGDHELWVIAGDLPSAYLVTDDAATPREAVEMYCILMDDWVDAVRAGDPLDDVFPVDAAATTGNAESLASRLQFVREQILPFL